MQRRPALFALFLALLPGQARARPRPAAPQARPGPARAPRRKWRYIVIHHSGTRGGSVRAFEAFHRGVRGMPRGMAYHFVIGNGHGLADGALEAGPRWGRQQPGAHVASALREPETGAVIDEIAIGVCLVGDLETAPPTEKQRRTLAELVERLRREFDIPPKRVIGHSEVHGAHTACPGRKLSLTDLRSARPKAHPPPVPK